METKSTFNENVAWIAIGILVVVVGFIAVPPLIRKLSNKAYKSGSRVTEQNFIDSQPEIVKKERNNS